MTVKDLDESQPVGNGADPRPAHTSALLSACLDASEREPSAFERIEAIAAALKEEPGRWRELREKCREILLELDRVERARAEARLARALKVSRQVLQADLAGPAGDEEGERIPGIGASAREIAAWLVGEAMGALTMVRSPDGDLFAVAGAHAIPTGSVDFRRILSRLFMDRAGDPPSLEALEIARNAIEAMVAADGETREVGMRVLALGDRTWIDLCQGDDRVIEVGPGAWRIVGEQSDVLFRRPQGALPMPEPRGGSIGALDRYLDLLRVPAEARPRVKAWALAAMRGQPPYPLLVIFGEQGTGKTTTAEAIARLVDPQRTGGRSPPREARDLVAAARNAHVISFDNVSSISADMSDDLCRLATGAGLGGRKLYTDHDEATFFAARPVIMTTIDGVPARPDLLDRAYLVELEVLGDEDRMPDADLKAGLRELLPAALGELLDMLARGLARLPHVKIARLPRMADAARLAEASGLDGFAESAIADGRGALRELAAQDPVAAAIERLLAERQEWRGTAAELCNAIAPPVGDRSPRGWPETPRAMAGRLRRLAPALRTLEIEATFAREGHGRERIVRLERAPARESTVQPAAPPSDPPRARDGAMRAMPCARELDQFAAAAAALAKSDLERGRKLAEAALGRGIEGAKLWELAKLGVGAADLIAAELHNLAEGPR